MAGLKQLVKLPKLTRLTLSFDRLNAKQITDLRKLFSHCKVENGRNARVPIEIFDPIGKKAR
ncbi:hypothetical protein BH11CYA1_BH11CYA1_38090 [soil metagenome]